MDTFFLFGNDYATAAELHAALKMMLRLPEYYGMNFDALHDCLGEHQPIRLLVNGLGNEAAAKALRTCMQVVEDCGGEAVLLHE